MKINILAPAFKTLIDILSKKHRFYFTVLIVLTIGLSLIETVGISIIMPFISTASNPAILDSGWYKKAFDFSGLTDKTSFIIALGAGIIIFYIFRAVYSICHMYLVNRFSLGLYKYFSTTLFNVYLSIPYKVFAQKNTAELMQIATSMCANTSTLALNILQFGSELFTIVLIYALMIAINWKMTIVLSAALFLLVVFFLYTLAAKSKSYGIKMSAASLGVSRTFRETFGNFKFVKLKGSAKTALKKYKDAFETFARAQVISQTLGAVPKNILESLGFSILVGIIIFILWSTKDATQVIPTVSMYALALYRILPSIHRMLGNMNTISYNQRSLELVAENIRHPVDTEGDTPVIFRRNICLENASFNYVEGKNIFNSISLKIEKGDKVAFTGESGCGKSTLVDLLIGIHKPVSGSLYIDGVLIDDENRRGWRSKIGYIPQSIYLFDGTVAENITIGSKYDEEKIKSALKMANIWNFLETKDGIETRVGEGGIQLSGGQQQRIGIARALYDNPEVLVLDEATSALDTETETKIMEEIYSVSQNKTLIVIAHRLSTVQRCNRKIRMENGALYEQI